MKPFNRDDLDTYLQSNEMRLIFSTQVDFSEYIESLSLARNLSLFDTLLFYVEVTGCEYEQVAKMLTDNLKAKISVDLEELGDFVIRKDPSESSAISF